MSEREKSDPALPDFRLRLALLLHRVNRHQHNEPHAEPPVDELATTMSVGHRAGY